MTIIALVSLSALTGLSGPAIAANRPTPWSGLTERLSIGAYLLWFAVLAITLLRPRDKASVRALASQRCSRDAATGRHADAAPSARASHSLTSFTASAVRAASTANDCSSSNVRSRTRARSAGIVAGARPLGTTSR